MDWKTHLLSLLNARNQSKADSPRSSGPTGNSPDTPLLTQTAF